MSKDIVFCGGGNMAENIIKGLLYKKVVLPENVTVNELLPARCEYLSKTYGITAVTNADDAIKRAGLVIIAVNPLQVPPVTKVLNPLINEKTIVLSIAAGIPIKTLENQLGSDRKIVRVVPNTLIQAGSGYSAVCMNGCCDDQDKSLITHVLDALGQIMYLKEDLFNSFSGFSNVGPLWLYKMVEALTDAGVYVGFSRTDARNMVIKNMLGTAVVLEETGEHPAVKVDQMTSPGGVSIEALKVLQQGNFSSALMNSVIAGIDKANSIE
ncbi:pyrroline-5-carboxylate reductase [Aminipila luticellarii]|nr:pyrroline-5-carboxylate reductase [Aminipila luticellarii]